MKQAQFDYSLTESGALSMELGDILCVSGLLGTSLSGSLESAFRTGLEELTGIVEEHGGSAANIARVTAYIENAGHLREVLYGPWSTMFSNENDRPAFKVLDQTLSNNVLVQINAVANLTHSRRRIDLSGVDARDPTVVIGDWVLTSRLHGTSPSDGRIVEGLRSRARQAVANGIDLVQHAGGSIKDIVQVCGFGNDSVYFAPLREEINEVIGADTCPVITCLTTFVRPEVEVMTEFTACIGRGEGPCHTPVFREIYLHPEHTNVPTGFQLGNVIVFPSGSMLIQGG